MTTPTNLTLYTCVCKRACTCRRLVPDKVRVVYCTASLVKCLEFDRQPTITHILQPLGYWYYYIAPVLVQKGQHQLSVKQIKYVSKHWPRGSLLRPGKKYACIVYRATANDTLCPSPTFQDLSTTSVATGKLPQKGYREREMAVKEYLAFPEFTSFESRNSPKSFHVQSYGIVVLLPSDPV